MMFRGGGDEMASVMVSFMDVFSWLFVRGAKKNTTKHDDDLKFSTALWCGGVTFRMLFHSNHT